MTRAEQETILRWSADNDMVSVFTAHPATRRKLDRAGYRPHKISTERGAEVGWFYRVPIGELRWRVGTRKKRVMSPAQLQVLRGGRA
jgi:hypothetical protein